MAGRVARCRVCGTTLNVNRSTRLCEACTHIVDENAKNLMNKRIKSLEKGINGEAP